MALLRDLRESLFGDLSAALLCFILSVLALVSCSHILCIPLAGWPVVLVFLGTCLLYGYRRSAPWQWRGMAAFVGVVLGCFLLNLCLLPTPSNDAELYHYPAIIALFRGWNPVYQSTLEGLTPFIDDPRIHYFHILFQSKGSWYFSFAFFRLTHLLDGGFMLAFLAATIGFCGWRRGFRAWFPGLSDWCGNLFSLLILLSPWCIFSIGDPMSDGIVYHLTVALCGEVLATVKKTTRPAILRLLWLSVLLVSIKFTAIVPAVLIVLALLGITLTRQGLQAVWRTWRMPLLFSGVLLVFLNVSPFITNTLHYASPLYPVIAWGEAKHNITGDFDEMNADRAEMNRLTRWLYAYVSKDLTANYFKRTRHCETWTPKVKAPEGIEGFGPCFRGLFTASCLLALVLAMWHWCKGRRPTGDLWALVILCSALTASSFVLPVKYIGYGRYAFGLYIAAFTLPYLLARLLRLSGRWMAWVFLPAVILLISACRLLYPSLGRLLLLSVQNAVAMEQMLREPQREAIILDPSDRSALKFWLTYTLPKPITYVSKIEKPLHSMHMANFTYTCALMEAPTLPNARMTAVGPGYDWSNYDRAMIASRMKAYIKEDFLPWLRHHPFAYPKAIFTIRKAQWMREFAE